MLFHYRFWLPAFLEPFGKFPLLNSEVPRIFKMTQLWRLKLPKSTSWCSFCSMTCWGYWAARFLQNLLSCFFCRPPVLRHRATQLRGYGSGAPDVVKPMNDWHPRKLGVFFLQFPARVAENVGGKACFI